MVGAPARSPELRNNDPNRAIDIVALCCSSMQAIRVVDGLSLKMKKPIRVVWRCSNACWSVGCTTTYATPQP